MDKGRIINEVRALFENLIQYSETDQLDSLLRCYAQSSDFLSVSADGIIKKHSGYKTFCTDYSESLVKQHAIATRELFHELDDRTWYVAGQEILTRTSGTATS